MQLLPDYFGLEDNAAMVEDDYMCMARTEYPFVHFQGI